MKVRVSLGFRNLCCVSFVSTFIAVDMLIELPSDALFQIVVFFQFMPVADLFHFHMFWKIQ